MVTDTFLNFHLTASTTGEHYARLDHLKSKLASRDLLWVKIRKIKRKSRSGQGETSGHNIGLTLVKG